MTHIETALKAIRDQILFHKGEVENLERIEKELSGGVPFSKRRGRPPKSAQQVSALDVGPSSKNLGRKRKAKSAGDVSSALKHLKDAGKEGVKAIRLAFLLKRDGLTPPSKSELLASEKVTVTGKGGGTTYHFSSN